MSDSRSIRLDEETENVLCKVKAEYGIPKKKAVALAVKDFFTGLTKKQYLVKLKR